MGYRNNIIHILRLTRRMICNLIKNQLEIFLKIHHKYISNIFILRVEFEIEYFKKNA